MKHLFSLIVPVYKQEKTILHNLQHLHKALSQLPYPYEIITVVDGMVDNSFDQIKQSQIPHLKAIAYKHNQGKSFAIRVGMHYAQGDYVMFIDAGMEIDPEAIAILLNYMDWHNADIVIGSKRHPDSIVHYSQIRKLLSNGYAWLIRLLFQLKVRDTQTGIKVFKKTVLEKILPRLVEKKFAGDLEMLVVAGTCGFTNIHEAPVKLNYHLAGLSNAATLHSIFRIILDTLAIFYRTYILHYYEKPPKHTLVIPSDITITTYE